MRISLLAMLCQGNLATPQAVCHCVHYEDWARGVLRLVLSDENFAVEILHSRSERWTLITSQKEDRLTVVYSRLWGGLYTKNKRREAIIIVPSNDPTGNCKMRLYRDVSFRC